MSLSVIIPVHNGAGHLPRCLSSLRASSRVPDQVIVVDDGSTDASAEVARQCGATVIRVAGGPAGPAVARNLGAQHATGEILVFIDSDVAVHDDSLACIAAHFEGSPGLTALFGSYDDDPPAAGFVSRYKNLLHHHVHQRGNREASTFWAGCGAIRREPFLAAGGFDGRTYPVPSIEDIDLGLRMRRDGHSIRCCPDVLATHLKHWTFSSWLRTDIFCRAIPWSRLIVREGKMPNDLNLGLGARLSALGSWIAVSSIAIGPWFPHGWFALVAALALIAIFHADLLRLFHARGGLRFAVIGFGLQLFYLLYSSAVFAAMCVTHFARRLRVPESPPLLRTEFAESD